MDPLQSSLLADVQPSGRDLTVGQEAMDNLETSEDTGRLFTWARRSTSSLVSSQEVVSQEFPSSQHLVRGNPSLLKNTYGSEGSYLAGEVVVLGPAENGADVPRGEELDFDDDDFLDDEDDGLLSDELRIRNDSQPEDILEDSRLFSEEEQWVEDSNLGTSLFGSLASLQVGDFTSHDMADQVLPSTHSGAVLAHPSRPHSSPSSPSDFSHNIYSCATEFLL